MGTKVKLSKKEYTSFLNTATFLDYYYSLYNSSKITDTLIEENRPLIEMHIDRDTFHHIQEHARKKRMSSDYLLSSEDHADMESIWNFTKQLHLVLLENHLL